MTETALSAAPSSSDAPPPPPPPFDSDDLTVFGAARDEYVVYCNDVKQWVDLVEMYFDGTPDGLGYEVRMFTGHLGDAIIRSECSLEERMANIKSAHTHLRRIKLDCLKLVGIWQRDQIRAFDKKYRWSDLSDVSDGHFKKNYYHLKKNAANSYKAAKDAERPGNNDKSKDVSKDVYTLYADTYNANVAVLEYLDSSAEAVGRMAHKNIFQRVLSVLGWIISILLAIGGIWLSSK